MIRRAYGGWLWLVTFSLMGGCARVPDHELAQMADSSGITKPVTDALQTDDFLAGEGPKSFWWNDFDDPVLNRVMESALALSPTLQIAESKLKAANQIANQKRAALFPEVNLQGDSDWQHLAKDGFFRAFAPSIPAVVNDINLGLSFTYECDIWGKYRDIYRAALGKAYATYAEKIQAELILTTSIAYAYTQLQLLLKKEEIVREKEANRERIAFLQGKREVHKIEAEFEELYSTIDVLDTSTELQELSRQIEIEKHLILALAGLGQDASVEFKLMALSPLVSSLPDTLSLDLVARRPDLIAQKARVESAGYLIDAAKTDFYPNIKLSAFLGLDSVYWSTLFKKENYSGFLDPAIHLPIFTAGRLRAQLMESVADFNEAVYRYNETVLSAAREVVDQLSAISYLQKEIALRSASLEAGMRQETLYEKRFRHQVASEIVYLRARDDVLDLEYELTDLLYGKQLAKVLLIRSLGGSACGS